MSLRRAVRRRFRRYDRFHVAMALTILVVAYVGVPHVVRFVDAIRGYDPAYSEPEDFEGQAWMKRQVAAAVLPGITWEMIIGIILFLLIAVVWLTFISARSAGRHPPPR